MTKTRCLRFACWGVGVEVEASDATHLAWLESRLDSLLAGYATPLGHHSVQHVISVDSSESGAVVLSLDGAQIGENPLAPVALQYVCTRIKLAVAESTQACVVVHAGVVGIGGRAVLLPAHSFKGKTTLVRAMVSRGATYYSDDLAVFDEDGLVHPFAKTLSVRGATDDGAQVEHTVESLGGAVGAGALPVGLVLFTQFAPGAVWAPRALTPGQATLKFVEHTLNVRTHPEMALRVLRKVVTGGAVLWESDRCDAEEVAEYVFEALGPVAGR